MGISQYRLAKDISVPQRRISEITQGKRSITADTALRLGRFFGMEAQFWLNLQSRYDLLSRFVFVADGRARLCEYDAASFRLHPKRDWILTRIL
jgi:addiction module HigA family antidote